MDPQAATFESPPEVIRKGTGSNPRSWANLRQNRAPKQPEHLPQVVEDAELMPASSDSSPGQSLTSSEISAGTLGAAQFLNRLVRNTKAGLSLRFQAACRVLEFGGYASQAAAGSTPAEAMQDLAGRLSEAFTMRARAASAQDAEFVRPGRVLDQPTVSQEKPEKG